MIDLEKIIKSCLLEHGISYELSTRGDYSIGACIPGMDINNPYKKYIAMELTAFSFDIFILHDNDTMDTTDYTVLDCCSERIFCEENIKALIEEFLINLTT